MNQRPVGSVNVRRVAFLRTGSSYLGGIFEAQIDMSYPAFSDKQAKRMLKAAGLDRED